MASNQDPFFGLGPPRPKAGSEAAARPLVVVFGVVLAGLAALDFSCRFLPWGVQLRLGIEQPTDGAEDPLHYRPSHRREWVETGDLVRIAGLPASRYGQERRMVFTTDERGYRNHGPRLESADIVVFGDSFAVGGALTDGDTLPEVLAGRTGLRVYNHAYFGVGTRVMPGRYLASAELREHPPRAVVWEILDRLIRDEPPPPPRPEDLPVGARIAARRARFLAGAPASLATPRILRKIRWQFVDQPPENGARIAHLPSVGSMLFLGDDIEATLHPDGAAAARLAGSIAATREALGQRGVTLIVLVVPGKWDVYGPLVEAVDPPVSAPPAAPSQGDLLEDALRPLGVPVVNLRARFRDEAARRQAHGEPPIFVRDDAHWNAEGVRVAVAPLAAEIERLGIARPP